MKLGTKFEVETMLVHECGQKLRAIIEVFGEDAEITVSEENRVTCTSFFAANHVFFYEQGGTYHVTTCPTCSHRLPYSLNKVEYGEFTRTSTTTEQGTKEQ